MPGPTWPAAGPPPGRGAPRPLQGRLNDTHMHAREPAAVASGRDQHDILRPWPLRALPASTCYGVAAARRCLTASHAPCPANSPDRRCQGRGAPCAREPRPRPQTSAGTGGGTWTRPARAGPAGGRPTRRRPPAWRRAAATWPDRLCEQRTLLTTVAQQDQASIPPLPGREGVTKTPVRHTRSINTPRVP